jgi:hypothetical protein
MTKFNKGDFVRVHAKKFDGERDEEGRLFSEKWEQDGNGEWCYGTASHVYRKKGRQPQNYRIKYDEGTAMQCTEEHIETAAEGQNSECSTEEEFCPFEDELADSTFNCKHVSMGRYKIATGPHNGHLKMKQSRCKYC